MTKYIYKNRQLIPQTQAKLDINERGFLFGDGIFESCKIYNGKIYDFRSHLNRLKNGLENIKLDSDISDLEKKSFKLIKKNQIKNGILKISISRGIGSLGYLPSERVKPLTIIQTLKSRSTPAKIKLGISTYKTPNLILGKSMNSLNYILSKIEAKDNDLFDTIMLSQNDNIAECSSANVFWIKDLQIFTSPISSGIIAGTKRQKLLEISPFKISEKLINLAELKQADEIFLTNSAFLILPVDEFCNNKLEKKLSLELLRIFKNDLKESCKN